MITPIKVFENDDITNSEEFVCGQLWPELYPLFKTADHLSE